MAGSLSGPDDRQDAFEPTVSQRVKGLMAGPVAGIFSRFLTYPFDTLKARLQLQGAVPSAGTVPSSTLGAAMQALRMEGARGLYRGFGAVVLGSVPGNLAYFTGYEAGKVLLPEPSTNTATTSFASSSPILRDMAIGAMAQLVGGIAFTPMDIVKERMQVQGMVQGVPGAYVYRGALHAVACIVRDGGALSLFRGYWATNAVWLPWNVLYIAAYEQSKRWALAHSHAQAGVASGDVAADPTSLLSPLVLGSCSAASASLAGLLTHPMDVVKTRLQVLPTRSGALQLAQQMWRQEGPGVFMRGVTARLLTLAPGTALSWMVYEPLKRLSE